MRKVFRSNTIYMHWLLIVITAVCLFSASSWSAPNAACIGLFTNNNSPASTAQQLAETIFNNLTATSMWTGEPLPNYFRRYSEWESFPSGLNNFKSDARLQFMFDKLNSPHSFKSFIERVLSEAEVNQNSGIPKREAILSVLHKILDREGFNYVEVDGFITPGTFLGYMQNGTMILEGKSFNLNGHGRDSHLIQIAYLAAEFRSKLGEGFLDVYKFMGKNPNIWDVMIDSPSADHLGNPNNIQMLVSKPLGLQ